MPRFSKDYQPNPGGKVGRTAHKTKKRILTEFVGKAAENVEKAVKKGDVKTSIWLIEHMEKKAAGYLEGNLLTPLVQAMESLDDVERVSHAALLLAIKGDMTMSQLQAVQEALARHTVLAGTVELAKLREEVQALREAGAKGKAIGNGHMPLWGKLRDVTPNGHDAEPAE